MTDMMTLQELDEFASRLPPAERLKLAARICERLSDTPLTEQSADQSARLCRERMALVDALVAEAGDIDDDSQGSTDAAAEIRSMRRERMQRICQNCA